MITLEYGDEQIPVKVEDDEWYVTLKSDGQDRLTFVINSKDPIYNKITEESVVYTSDNKYLVKNIDEHDTIVTVDCVIDLDDWKDSYFAKYMSYGNTLAGYMTLLMPSGWNYSTVGDFSEKKAIGVDRYNTPTYIRSKSGLEMLALVCDLWGAVPRFDVLNKVVKIVQTDAVGFSGEFYSDEVNLKSLGFVGNSTDIATRVYWYGKEQSDGNYLTMAEANKGLEYVENTTYIQKTITYGYVDTSIDNPYDLYNKAMDYLLKHCKPMRSYQLQVKEVSMNLEMFSTVLIIDSVNQTRDYHQVVEMKIYPECHSLDSVTLDSLTPDNSKYYKNGIYIPESDMDTKSKIDSLDNRVSKLESNSGGSSGSSGSSSGARKVGGPDNTYGSIGVYNAKDKMDLRIDRMGIKGVVDYSKDATGNNAGLGHFAIGETIKPSGNYSYLSESYLPYVLVEKPTDAEATNIADGIGRVVVGGYNGMTKECQKSSAETSPNSQKITESQETGYNIPMRIHGIIDIDQYYQPVPYSDDSMNTDVLNVRYGMYRFLHTEHKKDANNVQQYKTDVAQGAFHVNAKNKSKSFKSCRTDFVRLGNLDKPYDLSGTYNSYTLVNNLVLQGNDDKCYCLKVVDGKLSVEALSDVTIDDFK